MLYNTKYKVYELPEDRPDMYDLIQISLAKAAAEEKAEKSNKATASQQAA